jgi:hypothetical protein
VQEHLIPPSNLTIENNPPVFPINENQRLRFARSAIEF